MTNVASGYLKEDAYIYIYICVCVCEDKLVAHVCVGLGPPCYDNVKMSWMYCMSYSSYHVVCFEGCCWANKGGMNELKCGFSFESDSVWNLCLTHVNPMSCSIIARKDNPNVPPIVTFQWKYVVGLPMVWKFGNCMFSWTSFKKYFIGTICI